MPMKLQRVSCTPCAFTRASRKPTGNSHTARGRHPPHRRLVRLLTPCVVSLIRVVHPVRDIPEASSGAIQHFGCRRHLSGLPTLPDDLQILFDPWNSTMSLFDPHQHLSRPTRLPLSPYPKIPARSLKRCPRRLNHSSLKETTM